MSIRMSKSKWQPTEGVTLHSGGVITEELDFFAMPSAEIGSIITASSSLVISKKAMEPSRRWMFVALGAFMSAVIIQILPFIFGINSGIGWHLGSLVLACIVGLIVYSATGFSAQCSYVGDRGIEEYTITGSRRGKITSKRLKFSEAIDLYTAQTRMYRNGIYTGTTYDYRWTTKDSQDFRLFGSYHNQKGWPTPLHGWHCANSGETVWSNYRLKNLNHDLEENGFVEFAMKGNPKAVRIGSGFLEFVLKNGSTQRVSTQDMKKIQLGSGTFDFVHNDAKWWSGKGKYSFTYSTLPNAKLFLFCLERLVGIKWT